MRGRIVASGLLVLGFAALGIRAGDGWVDKDWHQWSKDEVNVVLHDSPWSKRWAKGQVNTSAAVPGVSGAGQEGAAGENAPRIDYYFQIRILNRRYDDVILVHVIYSSNIQSFERDLATYWQSVTQDSIKDKVYLITERGDRISPNRFVSSRTGTYEFELDFPRTVNGEPLIHPSDKQFSIQFTNPPVGNTQATGSRAPNSGGVAQSGAARTAKQGTAAVPRDPLPLNGPNPTNTTSHTVTSFKAERVLIQFNVDSMMWKGKLTY
jgi:hypothetical protein